MSEYSVGTLEEMKLKSWLLNSTIIYYLQLSSKVSCLIDVLFHIFFALLSSKTDWDHPLSSIYRLFGSPTTKQEPPSEDVVS